MTLATTAMKMAMIAIKTTMAIGRFDATIARYGRGDTMSEQERKMIMKGATGDSEVKCLTCGHHRAERPCEVYCNILCKWVCEKDYCSWFEVGVSE